MQTSVPGTISPLLTFRATGWFWPPVIGASIAAVGLAARAALGLVIPDIYPFPLVFPAVLGATLIAGWRAGLVCLVVGEGLGWYFFFAPLPAYRSFGSASLVTLGLSSVCAAAMIVIVERRRRANERLQLFQWAAAAERERLLEENRAALAEGEARLRIAVEAAQVGVWEWRLDSGEMIYSPEARVIYGFAADETLTLDRVLACADPDDASWVSAQASRALDPEVRDTSPYEFRIVRPDGEVRWVTASGRAVFERRDGQIRAARYLGALIDVTERQRAEMAIRASERRLTLALAGARMLAWEMDVDENLTPSPDLLRFLGLPPDAKPKLGDLRPSLPPGEAEHIQAVADRARERREPFFEVEFRYRMPDGDVRWFGVRTEVQLTADGVPNGAIGVVMDVTDRKSAEERLQLLAREVDHRANNLMSVIQATISLSRADTAEDLRNIVVARLHALARTTHLLSGGQWVGADLRRLVEEELSGFGFGEEGRINIKGPPVALGPEAAQAMAMSLHELATNAFKHGSLSVPEGRVDLAWRRDDGRLRLTWTERGGPKVVAPARKGFGTSILARALGGPLDGDSRLLWREDGLVCELELPLRLERTSFPGR